MAPGVIRFLSLADQEDLKKNIQILVVFVFSVSVIFLVMLMVICRPTDCDETVGKLARQLRMQQQFAEERARTDGDSGVKQTRMMKHGTKNYYTETFSGDRNVMTVHDHSNYRATVGMAELNVVMNGVDFKTRHNDYALVQPARNDSSYNALDEIEFPGVPPEVTDLADLDDQIAEMKEWFKAWRDGNYTVRDYRNYFKALMCYMEGAWTMTDSDEIDEPFTSDRHFLDAPTWSNLHEKQFFTGQSGSKHNSENLAFLPTTIVDVVDDEPIYAQWNYRILCHPLTRDVPINRFILENDLTTKIRHQFTDEQLLETRAARFSLNPEDSDIYTEGFKPYGLLDELMAEIPGKNNYGADFRDDALDVNTYEYTDLSSTLNTGYYHREYLAREDGEEGGSSQRLRGFADANLYMAMTDHPEIASTSYDGCPEDPDTDCKVTQRWSYAIPLEMIYLTPLNTWNPHNIEYKGLYTSTYGKTVHAYPRRGGTTSDTAFDGSNSKNYYITPAEFYSGDELEVDRDADTVRGEVGVLNPDGDVVLTAASGIRVLFPEIADVGILRQRWPILPIHGEGSAVWKELNALKDIVLNPISMAQYYSEVPNYSEGGEVVYTSTDSSDALSFMLKESDPAYGSHTHTFTITNSMLTTLLAFQEVTVQTGEGYGHSHTLTLYYTAPANGDSGKFMYIKCDTKDRGKRCFDSHPFLLKSLTA